MAWFHGAEVCFDGSQERYPFQGSLLVPPSPLGGNGVFTLPDTDTDFTFTDTGTDTDTMGFKPNCIGVGLGVGVGVGQCEHTIRRPSWGIPDQPYWPATKLNLTVFLFYFSVFQVSRIRYLQRRPREYSQWSYPPRPAGSAGPDRVLRAIPSLQDVRNA